MDRTKEFDFILPYLLFILLFLVAKGEFISLTVISHPRPT